MKKPKRNIGLYETTLLFFFFQNLFIISLHICDIEDASAEFMLLSLIFMYSFWRNFWESVLLYVPKLSHISENWAIWKWVSARDLSNSFTVYPSEPSAFRPSGLSPWTYHINPSGRPTLRPSVRTSDPSLASVRPDQVHED